MMRIKYISIFISILLISEAVMSGCMLAVRPYGSAPESAETTPAESDTAEGQTTDDISRAYMESDTAESQTTVDIPRAYDADYYGFYDDIIINTLKEGGMNVVSPVNIYCCMSLLAQTAAGNTQKQILDALGASDSADLYEKTKKIIGSFQRDGEFMKTLSANSLWFDDRLNVKEDCADKLKKEYAAHIGRGRFSDEKYLAEMNKWLSEKTGGLLDGKTKKIEAGDDDRAMLLSTLYLSARWKDGFYYDESDKTLFNDKTTCRYMKCVSMDTVYFGDGFTAYKKPFLNHDGAVWLFLPDEDKTVCDVIDKRPVEYIFSEKTAKSGLEVHLTVPGFDVCSEGELNGALKSCGISDAFDAARSDFTPLAYDPLMISSVSHAARVKADDEGVEAAAYTGVTYAPASAEPESEPEKYYFDLYRTFLFVVTDINGVPLFAGIIDDVSVK